GSTWSCQAFGICTPTTTDPNWQTDCPNETNAKCCTTPYSCAANCENPNSPTRSSSVVFAGTKLTLTPQELQDKIALVEDSDVVRVNPSDHPWTTDLSLSTQISKYSSELGAIVKLKQ